MDTTGRRVPWLLIASTALMAAVLTLGVDRAISAIRATPTPSLSDIQPVIVQIATPEPTAASSPLPAGAETQLLQQMQQQNAQMFGFTFVLKAQERITFALEALAGNDMGRAEDDLVAARAELDEAFALVPEGLKPQIDTERVELSRIRADLEVNPRDLDRDLRRMRDRLLSLIASQSR